MSMRDARRIQTLEDEVEHLKQMLSELETQVIGLKEAYENFRDTDSKMTEDKPIDIPEMPDDVVKLGYKKPDPPEMNDGG